MKDTLRDIQNKLSNHITTVQNKLKIAFLDR